MDKLHFEHLLTFEQLSLNRSVLSILDLHQQAKASVKSGPLAIQSLCDHLSVHDGDVHEEKQDYKEIVHETQKTEKGFRKDVERRGQVGEGSNQAEEDSNPEHPEQTTHGKHLPESMTEQGGHIPQPVHKRSWLAGESAVVIINVS